MNVPSTDSLIASVTATSMPLTTEVSRMSQYSAATRSRRCRPRCPWRPSSLAACEATEAGGTGDREDDVGALADQLLADRLALGLVLEVLGERAVLAVPAEELDVGAVVLVVLLDALAEARP